MQIQQVKTISIERLVVLNVSKVLNLTSKHSTSTV